MGRDTTIIITEFGSSVRKRGSRFVIFRGEDAIEEVAARRIERLILPARGASISTDAIELAINDGVPVFFSQHNGRPLAYLTPANSHGSARTRRAQYSASSRIVASLTRGFITGKIHNQREFLLKKVRNRRRGSASIDEHHFETIEWLSRALEEIAALPDHTSNIAKCIIVLEAHSASKYWRSLGDMIPKNLGFPGRRTRGASDHVNMLLNYGYAILRNETWSAVTYAGLDPFCGFLHADRSSRPSLVLDLMEEFRVPIVDSSIMNLVCKKRIQPSRISDKKRLTDWARAQVIETIANCLRRSVSYRGKSVRMHVVLSRQAELVARALRGLDTNYEPFLRRW